MLSKALLAGAPWEADWRYGLDAEVQHPTTYPLAGLVADQRIAPFVAQKPPILYYNLEMGIGFTWSAGKHGISEADALYAMQNAVYSSTRVKVNDAGRPDRSRRVFIGPQHEQTDRLIEVLIEMVSGGFVVYHVMPLGSYYKSQMEEER